MPTSEFLPHTADVSIRVQADSQDELFDASLQCMNRLLIKDYYKKSFKAELCQKVAITSVDTTSLLIDFLSEALTLSHVHKAIFFLLSCDRFTPTTLDGVLIGTRVPSFDTDVKAVTYHEAEVKLNEQGKWETVIIFDI